MQPFKQRQLGQAGKVDAFPQPLQLHLHGRVLQTGDVVEVAVVKLLDERVDNGFQVSEVDDEAVVSDRAVEGDQQPVGMPVELRTLMAGWNLGQLVC